MAVCVEFRLHSRFLHLQHFLKTRLVGEIGFCQHFPHQIQHVAGPLEQRPAFHPEIRFELIRSLHGKFRNIRIDTARAEIDLVVQVFI